MDNIKKDLTGDEFMTFSIDSPTTGAIDDCVTIKKLESKQNNLFNWNFNFYEISLFFKILDAKTE